jgi:Putative prokaryotic signal transducing protein
MNDESELVTLAYFSNAAAAGMACELLLNNGIDAILQGANFGALDPLPMVGGFSEIELLVPAAALERARELYYAFFESEESSLPENEDVSDE